jgi:hypothetical protein
MLKRFHQAEEFAAYLREHESEPGFFDNLAADLRVEASALRAAHVNHKLHELPSSLINLYQIYLDAPQPQIPYNEMFGDKEPEKLGMRQRSILNQQGKPYEPDVTFDDVVADIMRLKISNPAKWISEEFYGAHGRYSLTTVRSIFGDFEEAQRQSGLKLSRGQQAMQRAVAKHVSLDVYRDFYRKEVLPYANKYEFMDKKSGRMKVGVVLSDLHDLECDPFMLSVAIAVIKDMQPDIVLLNGDVSEQAEFGRWNCDPRNYKIKERADFKKKHIFGAIRAAAPNAQIDWVIGNHDWRILKVMADKTPHFKVLLSDVMGLSLADMFGIKDYGINLIAKEDLDFAAHTKKGIENELRKNYRFYYDQLGNPMYCANHFDMGKYGLSGTSGHVHKPRLIPFSNAFGDHTWMVTGCMAKTNAHYVEGLDQAQNGFGIFHLDTLKGGVQQELVNCGGDFIHIHGRYYYRNGHPVDQQLPA